MSDLNDDRLPPDCADRDGDTPPALNRVEALNCLREALAEIQLSIDSLSDIRFIVVNTILIIDRIRCDLYQDIATNPPGPQPFESGLLSRKGVDWDGPDLLHLDNDDHKRQLS